MATDKCTNQRNSRRFIKQNFSNVSKLKVLFLISWLVSRFLPKIQPKKLNQINKLILLKQYMQTLVWRGRSRIFSRGGGGGGGFFSRGGGRTLFFRSTKLISSPKAVKRRNFEKQFLGTFWKIFVFFLRFFCARRKKMRKIAFFFCRALSLKVSIYWRPRRLKKSFRVGRPKMDFLKSTKGGTLWVDRGSNP